MIVPYNALLYLALIRPLFCAGATAVSILYQGLKHESCPL